MRSTGHTLIELVTVIVVIGVLSAWAVPRFFDRAGYDARGYRDQLAATARYGRQLAISANCPVRLSVTGASFALTRPASVCDSSSFGASVTRPGGGNFAASTPDSVVLTGVPLTVTFQSSGATDLGADTSISVGGYALTFIAASGLVQASP
jgi:MSHA pilin protein MshC